MRGGPKKMYSSDQVQRRLCQTRLDRKYEMRCRSKRITVAAEYKKTSRLPSDLECLNGIKGSEANLAH
jgi:hypothetical protein